MKSRINIHNKKVTKAKPSAQARTCNCINKSKCPLSNKCLSNNALYKANITSTTENYRNKIYYGINETKLKSRYVNHLKSSKSRKYKTRGGSRAAATSKMECFVIIQPLTIIRKHFILGVAAALDQPLKTDTESFNEIRKLKEQNKNFDISWVILWIHQSYNTSTKRCMLYLNEKLAIAFHKEDNILNNVPKL